MIIQPFHDLLHFQRWATQRLAQWVEVLPDAWLLEPVAGSFPTVKGSLLHITDAEAIWLKRLQGQPLNEWPSKHTELPTDHLADYLRRSTAAFADHVSRQSDPWFTAWCTFVDLTGSRHRMANGSIVQHVVNHSSYHRGQVIGQVRQAADRNRKSAEMPAIPGTDYITWLGEQHQSPPGGDPELERIYGG